MKVILKNRNQYSPYISSELRKLNQQKDINSIISLSFNRPDNFGGELMVLYVYCVAHFLLCIYMKISQYKVYSEQNIDSELSVLLVKTFAR